MQHKLWPNPQILCCSLQCTQQYCSAVWHRTVRYSTVPGPHMKAANFAFPLAALLTAHDATNKKQEEEGAGRRGEEEDSVVRRCVVVGGWWWLLVVVVGGGGGGRPPAAPPPPRPTTKLSTQTSTRERTAKVPFLEPPRRAGSENIFVFFSKLCPHHFSK